MLSVFMDRPTVKRRKQQAARLLNSVNAVWNSLEKIPSFTGKARFMDQVKRAQTRAHNLHWNLEHDEKKLP
jgi:hypothetical protein